jgi:release factor glutamine methyltransferase
MRAPEDTIEGLLAEIRARFKAAGVADFALEARLLAGGMLGLSPTELILRGRSPVPADDAQRLRAAAARRVGGEPVFRILGKREFYGLNLFLSKETLEPRPDTEAVVDTVLPFLHRLVAAGGAPRILDLGTGTGAICLALLHECDAATGVGVDISTDALATARANAEVNGLGGRFHTILSDWFAAVEGRFDVIVSNPPYIPSGDIAGLDREVREHDPIAALDGGADGLAPYRIIANQALGFLEPQGIVAVEFGWNQLSEVRSIFEQADFAMLQAIKDYGGRDRGMIFGVNARSCGE